MYKIYKKLKLLYPIHLIQLYHEKHTAHETYCVEVRHKQDGSKLYYDR